MVDPRDNCVKRGLALLRLRGPGALTLTWEKRARALTMTWNEPDPPTPTDEDTGEIVPFRHRPTRPPLRPDDDPGPGDAA
jgi:hypothetical protein